MLYLLRHAESTASPDTPESAWPLSEQGREQAHRLVDRLAGRQIDVVYSSPYRRAIHTVKPLAQARDLPLRTDDRLRERRLTDQWLDDHRTAVRRVWRNFELTLPGGESSAACQRRMVAAIRDVRSKEGSDRGLLVSSHGNAIGLYLNHLDPTFGFEDWAALQNPDLFAIQDGRWRRLPL